VKPARLVGSGAEPAGSGATPYGMFQLADSYLAGARAVAEQASRLLTAGPVRLLSYHASELFLKAYLKERGVEPDDLRSYGHDLERLMEVAVSHGLDRAPRTVAQLAKIAKRRDYVRVRYVVVEDREEISADAAIQLAESVRDTVRFALHYDEQGRPEATSP